jgi:hypothetical protein
VGAKNPFPRFIAVVFASICPSHHLNQCQSIPCQIKNIFTFLGGRTADVPPPLLKWMHVKMKNNLKLNLDLPASRAEALAKAGADHRPSARQRKDRVRRCWRVPCRGVVLPPRAEGPSRYYGMIARSRVREPGASKEIFSRSVGPKQIALVKMKPPTQSGSSPRTAPPSPRLVPIIGPFRAGGLPTMEPFKTRGKPRKTK